MVAQQVLVLFVLVRIRIAQPTESMVFRHAFLFFDKCEQWHANDAETLEQWDFLTEEHNLQKFFCSWLATHRPQYASYVLLSNPITHCQTFLLLSPITHRFYYEQKSAKYSSKTNLIHLKKQPYWKKIIFQLRKNNFPVGKQNFSNWAFPASQLDFYGNSVL